MQLKSIELWVTRMFLWDSYHRYHWGHVAHWRIFRGTIQCLAIRLRLAYKLLVCDRLRINKNGNYLWGSICWEVAIWKSLMHYETSNENMAQYRTDCKLIVRGIKITPFPHSAINWFDQEYSSSRNERDGWIRKER